MTPGVAVLATPGVAVLVPPTLVVGTPCVGGPAGAVAEGAAEGCAGCAMGMVTEGIGTAVAVRVASG